MRSSTRSRAMRATSGWRSSRRRFRRLRQRHQHRRFRQRQPLRLLAEIGNGGGANAFEIAAERRQRQIEIENLILGQLPLDLDRAHHLAQLGVDRALAPRLHQPRQLHRDGRAAGDDVAAGDELQRGAAQRQRIDAAVGIEPPVLVGQQQFEIGRIDAGPGVDRQPPAAIGHRIGAQQFAVAVDDCRRRFARLFERQWAERDDPGADGDCGNGDGAKSNGETNDAPLPHPVMPGLVPAIHASPRTVVMPGQPGMTREFLRPDALISPDAPRLCRCRCGRSARDCTCPRHRPAAARICRAKPRAPHRPP